MTFRDLQRMIEQEQAQLEEKNSHEMERLSSRTYQKPFYQFNQVHE